MMQPAQVIACSKVITRHLLQSRQPTALYNPHKGIVNSVHINHTNKVIASCGQDGRIVLVNASKPDNEVFQTHFHSQSPALTSKPISVNSIMFSPQSHYIAAGSSDCLVKIWDMKNHKHVFSTIKSHVASVTSLAWIKHLGMEKVQGDVLASASSIGDIFLHSIKTSNIVETFNTNNQQSINQIKVSESEGYCRLAACTANGSVMVWNLMAIEKTTQPICCFNNGKKSSTTSVSFSSFNPALLASSSMDETLSFYDIHEKKPVKVINCEEPLTSINFHSDGHTLIAGGMYGALFVYDLRKPIKPRQKLTGHDSAIKHTVFIKQYETPKGTMSNSRASNTSSVTSVTSKTLSHKSISEEAKQVQFNNFVEPLSRKTDPVHALSQEKLKKQLNPSENIEIKRQATGLKLSSTGQEALKNVQQKSSFGKVNPAVTAPSGYSYYTKPGGQNVSTVSSIASKPSQQSVTKPSTSEDIQFQKPPMYQQPKSQSLPVSRVVEPSTIQELRELIEDRFERLHMEMLHQFHQQSKDFKSMITNLVMEDRKKQEKIKQLQMQIQQLKNNTY